MATYGQFSWPSAGISRGRLWAERHGRAAPFITQATACWDGTHAEGAEGEHYVDCCDTNVISAVWLRVAILVDFKELSVRSVGTWGAKTGRRVLFDT